MENQTKLYRLILEGIKVDDRFNGEELMKIVEREAKGREWRLEGLVDEKEEDGKVVTIVNLLIFDA